MDGRVLLIDRCLVGALWCYDAGSVISGNHWAAAMVSSHATNCSKHKYIHHIIAVTVTMVLKKVATYVTGQQQDEHIDVWSAAV